ncbi:MAG: UvrD-helicase domain-containing protein [Candidatus Obscuribacterales bacterium]|nr:UvrD-helicase domain-containing protein [Candidatus Obscuribacterales bacterium]
MNEDYRDVSITLIGASAGSGKTHRLSQEFVKALLENESDTRSVCRNILSTTFTNKAADELVERVRDNLLEHDLLDQSLLLLTGNIGTVNSVCGQLVQEFCFEAGLSPELTVLPAENVRNILSTAASASINSLSQDAEDAASRLSLPDWYEPIMTVVKLARANDLGVEQLKLSAFNSFDKLAAFFPSEELYEVTDESLHLSLIKCIEAMENCPDGTKKSEEALTKLKEMVSAFRVCGYLPWADWAHLAKLTVGKTHTAAYDPVARLASKHPYHPLLKADVRLYIDTVFRCAGDAMAYYDEYKRLHSLIDFEDQESIILKLLQRDDVCRVIRERVKVALVDEFQDTSPIQLAVFLKLASLIKKSIWVGDEKQAIYGFRGADPNLMRSLMAQVETWPNVVREQLSKSYRSRPELVALVNSLFSSSFKEAGMRAESIRIESCARISNSKMRTATQVWWLDGGNWDDALKSLSARVKAILCESDLYFVQDKEAREIRPLKGSDIGIFCRSNDRCVSLSRSLSNMDIPVSCNRAELLRMPECIVAFAALRFLVDKNDTLSIMELLRFQCRNDEKTNVIGTWLTKSIEELISQFSYLQEIVNARTLLSQLTPREVLEMAIVKGGVLELARKWGDFERRSLNLDSLRGLARLYEENCLSRRTVATAGGLVNFLFKELQSGGVSGSQMNSDAVQVLTYHAAKGLEFPFVILLDLQTPAEAKAFGVSVESRQSLINLSNPLADRWIRFWPWPYGKQSKGVFLDEAVGSSTELTEARKRALQENIRVLYVGATRARDYLVFAPRLSRGNLGWLDLLKSCHGEPVVSLPSECGIHQVLIDSDSHVVEVDLLSVPEEALGIADNRLRQRAFDRTDNEVVHLPYRLVPSEMERGNDLNIEFRIVTLGERLPIEGIADMELLGTAVHRYLAWDLQFMKFNDEDWSSRYEVALRICRDRNITQLSAESFILAADRLRKFLDQRFPIANWSTEYSVYGKIGSQRVVGRIDLLVETPEAFAVIDHKTFPGRFETWEKRAKMHYGQLATYAELVSNERPRMYGSMLVHLPIVGSIIEMRKPL